MAFPSIIRKLLSLTTRMGTAESGLASANSAITTLQTNVATKAPIAHAATATTYGIGTGSNYGHVKLSDATNSTSANGAGIAATPGAVKAAYDLANTANTRANTASTTANNAMPKSGGTFTGNVTMPSNSGSVILDISSVSPTIGTSVNMPLVVRYKSTNGSTYNANPFFIIPTSTNNGVGLGLQAEGALVVGSGESPKTFVSGEALDGSAEQLYLTSDNNIYFVTTLQSGYANRKIMTYNTAGNLTVPGTVTAPTFSGNLNGTASKATNDTKNQAITSYVRGLAVSGNNLVSTSGAGTATNLSLANLSVKSAGQLTTARSFQVNLASTSAVAFNGTAACAPGVTGVLKVANGGTGNTTGTAAYANDLATGKVLAVAKGGTGRTDGTVAKLTTARNFRVNLASGNNATFNGSADCNPGVYGVLGVGNGGTGNTTGTAAAANALTAGNKTINGALTITGNTYLKGSLARGTYPSDTTYMSEFLFLDNSGSTANNHRFGTIQSFLTSTANTMEFSAHRNDTTSTDACEFRLIHHKTDGFYATLQAHFLPRSTNTFTLGTSDIRWKNLYINSSAVSTSDERFKTEISAVPDALLDAWGDITWQNFKFTDSVAEKGVGSARIHTGVIAQRVRDVFTGRNVDPTRYGFFCHDSWDARDEEKDANGKVLIDGREAGDIYSIRYEEALCLEAAYQRREVARAYARIADLEERLARLEAQQH